MLGLALGRKGWHSGAEEELRRSLALEPSDPGAHFNLAVIYLQRQPVALELARRHYHRSIDLGGPADPSIEALLLQPNIDETAAKPPAMVRK
jgi:Flp pilus assembly protein TadD